MLLAVAWLLEGNFKEKWKLLTSNVGFFAYAFYFIVLLLGVFDAVPLSAGWKYIEAEIGLIVLPILLCSSTIQKKELRQIMMVFLIFLTAASIFCLVNRAISYSHSKDGSIFFYHSLVQPINHHAVYFSIFLFVSAIFFLKEISAIWLGVPRWIKTIWLLYCAFILVLLSSKMVLVFLLVYLFYNIFSNQYRKLRTWHKVSGMALVVVIVVLLFKVDNPIRRRFADILTSHTELLKEKFDKGTYFNGVEFRLLLWRITYDILKEDDAWFMGVGPTNAQWHLDKKYLELNLYSGPSGKEDGGYLIYNCHNQFLQTTLQSGLVGLFALILLYVYLIVSAFMKKDQVFISFILLLLCFSFVESLFERQYGVLLIAWLPQLFLTCEAERKKRSITRKTSST
jgi:O-antigen ligase